MSHIHCCLPLLLALSNTPQKTPDPLAFPWQAFAPRDMGDRDSSLIKTSKVQLLLNGSALMRGLRLVYDRLHAKMLTKMDFSHCSIHCKKETMAYAENWINYCHNVYDESYAHSLCLIFLSVIVCVCVFLMQQLECAERCSGKSLRSREWNWLEVLPWIPVDSAWVCSSCGAGRRRLLSYHTAFDWEGTSDIHCITWHVLWSSISSILYIYLYINIIPIISDYIPCGFWFNQILFPHILWH